MIRISASGSAVQADRSDISWHLTVAQAILGWCSTSIPEQPELRTTIPHEKFSAHPLKMLREAIAVIMVLFLSASIDTIQLQPSRQRCCWKLLTSIVKSCLLPLFHADLFSFLGWLATSCLHVLLVSKGSAGAKEKHGLLLKSDVCRQ